MNIKIINNSKYDLIKVVSNGREYLSNSSNRDVNINVERQSHICIEIPSENSFIWNLPAVLTVSVSHKDSKCYINCNLEFDINVDKENIEIVIENESVNYKERFFFESVKIVFSNTNILNKAYTISNTDTIIKKHKKFNLLVTALFPIVIINFILCLIYKDILFFLLGVIVLMFFSIPSIVDINKFNKICRDTNLVQNLFLQ